MTSSGVVPPCLRSGSGATAAVFEAIRTAGPITRDQVVALTGLSPATAGRQITALLDAGLADERPELTDGRGVGRPKIPLTLDRDRYCVAAMHVGAQRTTLAIADVSGRTLYSHAIATTEFAGADPEVAIGRLCDQLRELADRFSGRRVLWGGAALGGRVDAATGVVDHPILGWHRQDLGPRLQFSLQVPVSIAEHVQAMAAAELLMSGADRGAAGRTGLFFYARETVGMALTIDGQVHQPLSGAGSIAALPTEPGVLSEDTVAPLQSVIGSAAARAAAERLGSDEDAGVIFDARARVLGAAVAMLRDVINPDEIIVAGAAFSAHPRGLAPVQAAFDATTTLARPLEISPTRFGVHITETAGIAVALSALYTDPLAVVGRC